MTVSVDPRRAGPYNGNDATTAFPFAFKIFAKEDIQVVITDDEGVETVAVLDSDYSVTVNGDQDASPGGSVTYPISGDELPTGSRLTIIGALTYEQPTDIPDGNDFSASSIENALDRLLMLVQQVDEKTDRALVFPVSDENTGPMPLDTVRANMFLAFDADGLPIAAAGTTEVAVSAAAATVLDDASLEDMRTTLAVASKSELQEQTFTAFTTGGTTTAFTLTPTPAITSLAAGQRFRVKFNAANTSATPTLAISGQTAKSIKVYDGVGAKQNPQIGALAANLLTDVEYDGTDYVALDVPQVASAGAAPVFGVRAWVNFNGTGTVDIRAGGNVSSITDHGTGDYTINFTTALADTNYAPVVTVAGLGIPRLVTLAVGSLRINTKDTAGAGYDESVVCVHVVR